jgi:hypothetical protein
VGINVGRERGYGGVIFAGNMGRQLGLERISQRKNIALDAMDKTKTKHDHVYALMDEQKSAFLFF